MYKNDLTVLENLCFTWWCNDTANVWWNI